MNKKPWKQIGLSLVISLLATASWAAAPRGWTLLWNDEFDGAVVDGTKWRIEDAREEPRAPILLAG